MSALHQFSQTIFGDSHTPVPQFVQTAPYRRHFDEIRDKSYNVWKRGTIVMVRADSNGPKPHLKSLSMQKKHNEKK